MPQGEPVINLGDGRVFREVNLTCHYCDRVVKWRVYENRYTPDHIDVCDKHKYSPYS